MNTRAELQQAFLKIDKRTLLDRTLTLLQSSGSDRIFISGDIESYDFVPDLLPNCEPLGGIYSTLALIKVALSL